MTPIQQDDYARVYNLKILEYGKLILAIAAPIILGLALFLALIALNFIFVADAALSGGIVASVLIIISWNFRWHQKQLEEYSAWRVQFYVQKTSAKITWKVIVIPVVVVGFFLVVFYLVTILTAFASMFYD
ncbi:MAG TPA: hypothetical protein VKK79_16265 [Candidatus Lokiarchaeia archaeon]|nr:hypothetical protein [Candidatus Lokiarchaeia archaeon]